MSLPPSNPPFGDSTAEEGRPAALVARLQAHQEDSWRQGRPVPVEDYLEEYPALRGDADAVLRLVCSELQLREEFGRPLPLDDYLQRFPCCADRLREQFSPPADTVAPAALEAGSPPGGAATVADGPSPDPDKYPTVAPTSLPPPPPHDPVAESSFPGYEILGEVGRGGMGVVYRARDRKRDRLVALKTLQGMNGEGLYRFKREFRMLANVAHANLVPLYELISDGKQWCLAMEFVQGTDLLTHVRAGAGAREPRPSGHRHPPLQGEDQWERLRAALAQLAEGIQALHEAGKLHRDVKPSNALVTPEGRVVLLDFGLAADLGTRELFQSSEQHLLGTVAYMSPEQASAEPVSAATDWYSVGVVLYEAMTGRLPFGGSVLKTLQDKTQRDPPAPRELVAAVPEDLNALCVALLSRDPARRPTGAEILRCLTNPVHRPNVATRPNRQERAALLGRDSHMQALTGALLDVCAGHTVVVHVSGRSGMGKSALVQCFLEQVRDEGAAVVLAGQCYEKESVPYKAFDGLVDALGQHLKGLPEFEVQAVSPRDVAPLVRIFPALRALQSAAAPPRGLDSPDPQEVRRRAFAALRELLARLGDRRPLVLAVDDLQWGDLDSLALYRELLRAPDPPRLLFLGSHRSEEEETSQFLQFLLAPGPPGGGAVEQRKLAVDALSAAEAGELARQLLGGEHFRAGLAESIARESGGNPFFVCELVQHARAAAERGEAPAGVPDVTLPRVIWTRVERLPEEARRLLEILAVAGRPLQQTDAARAAGLGGDERGAVGLLRAKRLARVTGTADGEEVTTYHDRVRETVTAFLSPERLHECHRRLALGLEASGRADPETLALHFHGAGEVERAGAYFAAAADRAVAALAFDRAAQFYQAALELGPAGARPLRAKLAEALANARRGAEAAPVYLRAAAEATATEALELRRRAAAQYLVSGRIDEGMDVIHGLLASMGIHPLRTPFRALLSILYHRFLIWLRGLKFRERAAGDIPPEELVRIDTCWSIGLGLCCVDPFRGLEFQTRSLLLALRAGEPYRIVRALGVEIGHSSCGGGRTRRRTERIFRTALAIAERLQNPHGLGTVLLGGGIAAYFEGRWRQARELCDRAIQILREQCTGVTLERNEAEFNAIRSLEFLGELKELARRLPVLLQDAEARGDRYAATNMRTRLSYLVSLMNDDPEQARGDVRRAMEQWSHRDFHLQHYFELTTRTDICHYCGEAEEAWQLLREHWPAVTRSLLLRVQISRLTLLHLRARSALALAALPGTAARQREQLLREAREGARAVERERMAWSDPQALLIQAGVAAVCGRAAESVQILEDAEGKFGAADMPLYAAVARRRRGQLLGGAGGRQLIEEAVAHMITQEIRNPARWIAMYAPGFNE